MELNSDKNVTPVNCAISNANGIAALHESANPGISSLTHPILTLFDFPVATLRLDDLVEQQRLEEVSFIKIDTEGAESIIVEGSIETFKRFEPDFYIVVHTPESFAKCRELLDFLSWDYDDSNPDARPFMVRCVTR